MGCKTRLGFLAGLSEDLDFWFMEELPVPEKVGSACEPDLGLVSNESGEVWFLFEL